MDAIQTVRVKNVRVCTDDAGLVVGIEIIGTQGYQVALSFASFVQVRAVDFVFDTAFETEHEAIIATRISIASHVLLCAFNYQGGMIIVLRDAVRSDRFCFCYFASHLVHNEVLEWLTNIGHKNMLELPQESLGKLRDALERKQLFHHYYVGHIIPVHVQRLILRIAQIWPFIKEIQRLVHRQLDF